MVIDRTTSIRLLDDLDMTHKCWIFGGFLKYLRSCSVGAKSDYMATIKTSALVADIRGKVGGNIFSRNRGGAYVRMFTAPVNPSSTKQAAIRGLFGTMMTEFRALSVAAQTAWRKAVYPTTNRVGDAIDISGGALYIKANMNLMASGLPRLGVPPVSPLALTEAAAQQQIQVDAVFDSGTGLLDSASVQLRTQAAAFQAGEFLHLKASFPHSKGIASIRSVSLLLCPAIDISAIVPASQVANVDITAALNAGLGATVFDANSRISLEVGIMSEGEGIIRPIGNVQLDFVPSV